MEGKLGLRFVPDGKGDLAATFGPEDVFDYMYAVFHSPTYRTRYAEFLKIDFPRVPITSDAGLFRTLCGLGARLVGLHLMEDDRRQTTDDGGRRTDDGPQTTGDGVAVSYPVRGSNEVEQVRWEDGPRTTGDQGDASSVVGRPSSVARPSSVVGRVHINKEQFFDGVPQEVWDFHVGGYRVAEKWLKDRKGRVLTADDREHYRGIVRALWETARIMRQIDEAIGEWPVG
jgi:predicted helicase